LKNFIRILLVIALTFLLSATLQAQSTYAKLEKNRNILAKGLVHKLNKTNDTLILKSKKKIDYLYSVNKNNDRDFDVYINATTFKLPLNKLKKGKHVLVAVQSPKRIVFVVRILNEIPKLKSRKFISKEPMLSEPVKVVSIQKN